MRIRDGSSDVRSSDLEVRGEKRQLEMTVGEQRSDIAHSREELATAATIQSDLSGAVSVLAGQLQDVGVRRDGLQREVARSDDSRVGKGSGSALRSRGSPFN